MSIKRTAKYVAAVEMAYRLGLALARKHSSADQVYDELQRSGFYWDSKPKAWQQSPEVDPLREMDKSLIRVRVTAHMIVLDDCVNRVLNALKPEGFTVQEVSKAYPNVRDTDGAGRVYIALRND
jgi:hypothetical protein